jgi:leucyl aminopeptidase
MEVRTLTSSPATAQADAVVVGVYADGQLAAPARQVDDAIGGLLTRLIEAKEISGKSNEVFTLWGQSGVKAKQIVTVGMGSRASRDAGAVHRAAGAAARAVSSKSRGTVAFALDDDFEAAAIDAGVAGAIVGCHGQDLYRAERRRHPFQEILWWKGEATALERGRVLGDCVNFTRRLVNQPAEDIYPESFAQVASRMAGECGLTAEVWDLERLQAERCGALLAVARGSAREPRLVIVRHQGASEESPTLALVGKGVTFDSGGLSIKPSDGMKTMKCDMAGAATVLGAMRAIALLKLPVNVVGLMGLVENMTGPAAYKLGDVLTARSGKTIEVLNTDAEGRLVLADVLDVAQSGGADRIIDLATLTGACVVALGTEVAGLMTNDQAWCDQLSTAAAACGESVWQLPMFAEYDELIQSEVADIKNIGQGRWGGAITAAKLLEQFVGGLPWTHIDIAGPAFRDSAKPWCDAGASGAMVRTLVEVVRRLGEPA